MTQHNKQEELEVAVDEILEDFQERRKFNQSRFDVLAFINQEIKDVLAEVRSGVIGEDIVPTQDSDVLYAAGVAANAIRSEQREALSAIEKRYL